MSEPLLSIAPDATLSAAARKLRLYARPDTAIRQDIVDHVLRRAMWIDPNEVRRHARVDRNRSRSLTESMWCC